MSAITHWLVSELRLWRRSLVADSVGGYTETFADQGTVDVKVDQSTGTERMLAMQAGVEHTHNIYTEPTTVILRHDRLAFVGVDVEAPAVGDVVYKVLWTTTPSTPRYLKCAAERIETG